MAASKASLSVARLMDDSLASSMSRLNRENAVMFVKYNDNLLVLAGASVINSMETKNFGTYSATPSSNVILKLWQALLKGLSSCADG